MKRRTILLAALLLFALAMLWSRTRAAISDELPPRHSRQKFATSHGDREYVIHIPASCDKLKPTPLVIMLHGFGGTGLTAARETGWSAKAERESFIVAYPEATRPDKSSPPHFRRNPQAWNDGSGRFHAAAQNIDDVAFIDAMINSIEAGFAIDPNRIFVTGFSNGASMTFRVGAELSHRIAAIAPVAGTCWLEQPEPSHLVSLCYITGTADSLNPLDGGYPKLAFGGREQGGRPKPAVQVFIDQWVRALRLPEKPHREETLNGLQKRVYRHGSQQPEIVFITVAGHGHHWPGGERQLPEFLLGKSGSQLNATDIIWDFFKSHPRTAVSPE